MTTESVEHQYSPISGTSPDHTPERDPASGAEPLFATLPVVTVEGREYTLRRLGITDVMTVIRILMRDARGLLAQTDLDPQAIGIGLLMAIPMAEREVMDLLASLLRVQPAEFRDPDKFPASSLPDIIDGLAAHPDLEAFAKNARRLIDSPAVRSLTERVGGPRLMASASSGS